MQQPRIGPRWLTWLLLLFGALEIPWVIFLMFAQQRTATAYHTHAVAIGLSGGGALLAGACALALWAGARWLPVAAAMCTTLLTVNVAMAVIVSEVPIVWASLAGIPMAFAAAWRSLRRPAHSDKVLAAGLAAVAAVMLARLVDALGQSATTMPADHLRLLVVAFDTAEVVALLGLGLSLLKGHVRPAVVLGSMGVVLFVVDAWVNIFAVPSGQAFTAAIFYAVVGELPSTVMCAIGVRLAMRELADVGRPGLAMMNP